ncbi:hypothetical protein NECAME_05582 [Necator americanus]|uniref:Protein FAM76A n=1 Tax=Necator americanus TaxID=51031 RepID=W2SFV1_NECAM|nr:hypothetical protein NECAME_05582 [Necator americanus]ETN68499.1 hypothetical protein NECAME_05582 [Necator americanus]
MKKCCNCRSDLPESNGAGSSVQCEKCQKNEAKYGKPTTCKFCQLPAAFHEEKCVYCSHSERKFGAPIPCANCKLRAAFTWDPKKMPPKTLLERVRRELKYGAKLVIVFVIYDINTKPTLCRMCVIQARANKQTNLAGVAISSHEHSGQKRKREEKKANKSQAEPAKIAKRDPFADSGENVMLVQQLRDQITKLNTVVAQKDAAMLEKDKKIASLQADLMSAERKHREKVEQLLKEKDEAIQMVIERHRQANKQVKK